MFLAIVIFIIIVIGMVMVIFLIIAILIVTLIVMARSLCQVQVGHRCFGPRKSARVG